VGGICGTYGKGIVVYRVLVGSPKDKRPMGRPSIMWEDNIKLGLSEIGIDGDNWFQLAQNSVQLWACVKTVMKLRVS